MATKPKTCPPKFVEGMSFTSWKNKVEMWQLVTSVDKKEHAIVILLQSLEGHSKAEKAASELTAAELHNDNGMKVLFEKLDMVFESEKVDETYSTYAKFINFRKESGMSMNDYISECDHLYHRMTEHDMKLPDAVLAFKLLDGASLSQEERQLALAMGNDLKFVTMKSALKRVFTKPGTEPSLCNGMVTMQIKQDV